MVVHSVGIVAGATGAVFLLARVLHSKTPGQLAPIVAYLVGLLAMIGCSAVYNMWRSCRRREWLRRLDHGAIFVMIAGTYTPLTALRLSAGWGNALLATVWAAAALGVLLKLWRPRRIESISVAIYLLLGWIGVVALEELLSSVETGTLILLLIGGLLYSGGLVFHLAQGRRYQTALWHLSVLTAAAVHYLAVVSLVKP